MRTIFVSEFHRKTGAKLYSNGIVDRNLGTVRHQPLLETRISLGRLLSEQWQQDMLVWIIWKYESTHEYMIISACLQFNNHSCVIYHKMYTSHLPVQNRSILMKPEILWLRCSHPVSRNTPTRLYINRVTEILIAPVMVRDLSWKRTNIVVMWLKHDILSQFFFFPSRSIYKYV